MRRHTVLEGIALAVIAWPIAIAVTIWAKFSRPGRYLPTGEKR